MLRRRSRAAFLGAGVLALSILGTSASSAIVQANEWGGPGKTAARTAFNWRSGLTAANLPTLTKAWGVGGGTFTPPVRVGAAIIAGDNGGTGRARLRAFDATSGTVLWTKNFGSDTITRVGAPATNGNLVYVTVERATILGYIYDLYAYEIDGGVLAWSAEIGVANRKAGPRDVLFTSGKVLTPTAAGNGFKRLAVYNATTGVWLYSVTPGGNISAFAANPAVAYVASSVALEVYDLDTGSNVNTVQGGAGASSIIVAASGIYTTIPSTSTTPARITHFDSTGFVAWSKALAPGCSARARVLTAAMLGVSMSCANPTLPDFYERGFPALAMGPVGAAGGDRPIAAAREFVVAVGANGQLKAWDLRSGRAGLPITTPTLANPAIATATGGAIVAAGQLVVPERGGIEVFSL
jgi:PQQ-like domain